MIQVYSPSGLPSVAPIAVSLHTLLAYTSLTILEIGLPFGYSDGVDLSSTGASNGDALVKGITQR